MNSGDLVSALEAYQKFASDENDWLSYPEHWLNDTSCQRRTGDMEGARKALNEILKFDGANIDAWAELSITHFADGDDEGGQKTLELMMVLQRNSALAHFAFGEVLRGQEKLDESIEHYGKALALESTGLNSLISRATAAVESVDWERVGSKKSANTLNL